MEVMNGGRTKCFTRFSNLWNCHPTHLQHLLHLLIHHLPHSHSTRRGFRPPRPTISPRQQPDGLTRPQHSCRHDILHPLDHLPHQTQQTQNRPHHHRNHRDHPLRPLTRLLLLSLDRNPRTGHLYYHNPVRSHSRTPCPHRRPYRQRNNGSLTFPKTHRKNPTTSC